MCRTKMEDILFNTQWRDRSGYVFHTLFLLLLLQNNLNVAVLGTLAWFSSVDSSNLAYRIHMLPWSLAQRHRLYIGLVPTKNSERVGPCLGWWEFLVPDVDQTRSDVDQTYQQFGPSTFWDVGTYAREVDPTQRCPYEKYLIPNARNLFTTESVKEIHEIEAFRSEVFPSDWLSWLLLLRCARWSRTYHPALLRHDRREPGDPIRSEIQARWDWKLGA